MIDFFSFLSRWEVLKILTEAQYWVGIYEVCSKNKVSFKISRAMYIRFSIFFSYVGTLLPNVCSQF